MFQIFLVWLIKFVSYAFWYFDLLIFARVFLSWIPSLRNSKVSIFVYKVTEPFFDFLGKYLPSSLRYPLDFTPIVALFILNILENIIVKILIYLFG